MKTIQFDVSYIRLVFRDAGMITSQQMRAARALLGMDQRQLAELAGLSLPTIQRMESSDGQVRGVVDTLVKVITALESAGIEIIGENAPSGGLGRGVRLRETESGRKATQPSSLLFDRADPGEQQQG
jgi:transcriptional regulator with XRE-family HTH domain